jgi:hypothetical protein
MSDGILNMPGRGSLADPRFQSALRVWRRWAHRRGLVVGSPIRLIGAERTAYGDSDGIIEGPKSYLLSAQGGLGVSVGDLPLSRDEAELLAGLIDELDDRAEYDIKDIRVPETRPGPEEQEDERGRWPLGKCGVVVRVGEGSTKRYLLYLWVGGSWWRMEGAPPFDLPMFGLEDLKEGSRVMIHEGPKAWEKARERVRGDWVHVSWHGSEWGMEWTDWSPLRGREVLIWPDCDEAGLNNAQLLGARLAKMGNLVKYVSWSKRDMARWPRWDWADDKGPSELGRSAIHLRTRMIESPTGPDGRILKEWAQRSFLDLARREVYQMSTGYEPVALDALAVGKGKGFREAVVNSLIRPFMGLDFRPGHPQGMLADGKINLCPPDPREREIKGAPMDKALYRTLRDGWFRWMIPDVVQRKHVIRRAALAAAMPDRIPQHMIVLRGDSGIGKSVLLDLIAAVSGRGVSLFPETIFGRFNAAIMGKSCVCVHEIHSDDMTRKQNASRLKELVANQWIEVEEKNKPRRIMANVIHWFAATNESVPFALEKGNDRFYFVECAAPKNARQKRRRSSFFRKYAPLFQKEEFQDIMYSSAKWLVDNMSEDRLETLVSRAERQASWGVMTRLSRRPWQQDVAHIMTQFADPENDRPTFDLDHLVNIVQKKYKAIGIEDIKLFLNSLGFFPLAFRDENGKLINVRYRLRHGGQKTLWGGGLTKERIADGEKINTQPYIFNLGGGEAE